MGSVDDIKAIAHAIAAAIARKDVAALGALLAPGFVQRAEAGAVGAEAFLAAIQAIPYDIVSLRLETIDVDLFDNSAIATGVQHAQVIVDGKRVDDRRRFLDLFVRRDGAWLLQAAIEVGGSSETPSHSIEKKGHT